MFVIDNQFETYEIELKIEDELIVSRRRKNLTFVFVFLSHHKPMVLRNVRSQSAINS